MDNRKGSPALRIVIALATAVLGGFAFHLLRFPLPWLLGPMFAALIGSNLLPGRYAWPAPVRNAGLIVVGYTIGLALTREALAEIGRQLPYMLLTTVLLMLYCALIAYVVSKLSGGDYMTSLMGSIPGGLTQILTLAEESKGIELTVVTVTQVVRLMLIVVFVPLLVFSPLFGFEHVAEPAVAAAATQAATWSGLFPGLLVYAPVCVACALVGNKIGLPTAFFLGPAIGAAIVQMAGVHGPALPDELLDVAQLLVGTYVGLLLKPAKLARKARTLTLAVLGGFLLLAGAIGFSALLDWLEPVSEATALLSLAPGGMDQMGIIAHEIGADLSIVSGFQLFRMFFLFFLVPPVLRFLLKLRDGKGKVGST